MKKILLSMVAVMVFVSFSFAAGPNTYQVTGPVLEVKDDMIVVQKGKEKWEIAKDAATKVEGEVKVGAKVTIHYTMKAVSVEAKGAAKKAEPKKSEPAKTEAKPAAPAPAKK
jgi:ribosomal 50S subunit-recycling heat shock protein